MQRSEAAAEVSEFHMAASDDAGVDVHDLLTSLGDKARHADLRREMNRTNNQKKLPAPLEKPQAVRVGGGRGRWHSGELLKEMVRTSCSVQGVRDKFDTYCFRYISKLFQDIDIG